MKKPFLFILICLNGLLFSQTSDTIHLNEVTILPFIKDNNFIENKGKEINITMKSNALIMTSVRSSKDLKIRAIEFFFDSSNNNSCEFITTQLFIFDEGFKQEMDNLLNLKELYFTIDPQKVKNKIFNIENYDIELKKNKTYFIGLFFEPSENCHKFLFKGLNNKKRKVKTIINPSKNNFSNAVINNSFGLKYKIYYK